jgi:hypothetical protein
MEGHSTRHSARAPKVLPPQPERAEVSRPRRLEPTHVVRGHRHPARPPLVLIERQDLIHLTHQELPPPSEDEDRPADQDQWQREAQQAEDENGRRVPAARGLHSSTSQLNLSRVWSLKPQQAATFQLNLRRFCQ